MEINLSTERDKLIRNETEAIECLKSNKPTSGYVMLQESIDMAINALEKQIPKKVEIRKATNDDIESELRDFITVKGRICRCPSCRCCIHISELKYCRECGQKLDWGGEE